MAAFRKVKSRAAFIMFILLTLPITVFLATHQQIFDQNAYFSSFPYLVQQGKLLQLPKGALIKNGFTGNRVEQICNKQTIAAPPKNTPTVGDSPSRSSDLSTTYSIPVGYQGNISSCTAWAMGYYLYGYYAIRDGYYPKRNTKQGLLEGFAPMSIYSVDTNGTDKGTGISDMAAVMKNRGIDTRADYLPQGDFNFSILPNYVQIQNAQNYKIASYTDFVYKYIYKSAPGGALKPSLANDIRRSIDAGNPVAIVIPLYNGKNGLYCLNKSHTLLNASDGTAGTLVANHVLYAPKYDSNGLWVENQWGTGWGYNGWAELGWDFIDTEVINAVSIIPIKPSCTDGIVDKPSYCPSTTISNSCTQTPGQVCEKNVCKGVYSAPGNGTCSDDTQVCCTRPTSQSQSTRQQAAQAPQYTNTTFIHNSPTPTPTPSTFCQGYCASSIRECNQLGGVIKSWQTCSVPKTICCIVE